MKNLIIKNSSGRKVLFFFVLANVVYLAMMFYSIPKVKALAGGLEIPDLMPGGYDKAYINALFTRLGNAGREVYLQQQIPLDMLYPFLFGVSYCLMLAFFLNKLGKLNSKLFYLTYLPLLACFFDYLENFGLYYMLKNFPDFGEGLVKTNSIFSVLKSSFSTLYFIVLIITLLVYGFWFFFRKARGN